MRKHTEQITRIYNRAETDTEAADMVEDYLTKHKLAATEAFPTSGTFTDFLGYIEPGNDYIVIYDPSFKVRGRERKAAGVSARFDNPPRQETHIFGSIRGEHELIQACVIFRKVDLRKKGNAKTIK